MSGFVAIYHWRLEPILIEPMADMWSLDNWRELVDGE